MTYLAITACIFTVELRLKKYMDAVCALDEQHAYADGRIILKKYYNTGAAGNFLSGHPKAMQCLHAAVLGGVLAGLLSMLPKKGMRTAKLGLAFAAGGGLSNLHDRLTKGHVVDYVSFGHVPNRFRKYVFNISDFFIFLGILLISAYIIVSERK